MDRKHRVLIVPGLDGRTGPIDFLTRSWEKKYNLYPESVPIVWKDGQHFAPKLASMLKTIDRYLKSGDLVSVVGGSAGGSAALNAFVKRRDKICKAVNIDGFLRPGKATGFRSFETRTAQSVAFKESVLLFVQAEPSLTRKDRKKILTVRPLFGDELVPPDTVTLDGALNTTVLMGEHVLSIALALIKYDPVIKFLAC